MTRRTVYYSGHVQGVGFRFVVRQLAASLAVTGFVRNLSDGRVQLVAEGEPAELNQLVARVREKMQGYIDQVAEDSASATGEFERFEIRR